LQKYWLIVIFFRGKSVRRVDTGQLEFRVTPTYFAVHRNTAAGDKNSLGASKICL